LSELVYRAQRQRLGKLDCVVVQPEDSGQIETVGVFCHGFGAPGDDLVGIAQELLIPTDGGIPNETGKAMQLIFPAATLSLDAQGMPGARAWWLLSIARLIAAMESGQFEQIREEVPEGIDESRENLTETISIALEMAKLTEKNLLLGGFSQGAMLSMDVACRGLKEPPAALCLYSGALICEKYWKANAARLSNCKIIQSHGRQDPILPFTAGVWLRDLLRNANCEVDFIDFNGPHTIPFDAIERTSQLLASV
jgi:phospholipase/carboxylesterase